MYTLFHHGYHHHHYCRFICLRCCCDYRHCRHCRPVVVVMSLLDYYTRKDKRIEGSRPERFISTIYHAWDTPFWSGNLDMFTT